MNDTIRLLILIALSPVIAFGTLAFGIIWPLVCIGAIVTCFLITPFQKR